MINSAFWEIFPDSTFLAIICFQERNKNGSKKDFCPEDLELKYLTISWAMSGNFTSVIWGLVIKWFIEADINLKGRYRDVWDLVKSLEI